MKLSAPQLSILQHSLGVDQFGQGNQYRNRYVVGPDCYSYRNCQALAGLGLMKDWGPQEVNGGMTTFTVTDAGVAAVAEQSPKPPKISRSKQRYRAYLHSETSLSFGDWLRAKRYQTI